jgi:putative NADH-flavin reductase
MRRRRRPPRLSFVRITVFGASGRTGRSVVEQALEQGHEVVAFVREVSAFGEPSDKLDVDEGDARDAEAVADAIRGSDAVISVLGLVSAEDEPEHSQATRTVVDAARAEGVRRVIVTANATVFDDEEVTGEFAAQAREHRRNRETLRESGLDWTLLASARLADEPPSGVYEATQDERAPGGSIAPADLAKAALEALARGDWVRHIVGVSGAG